jgi:hypothetical protein
MPNAASNIAHTKGTADIVDNSPRARLAIGHSRLTRHGFKTFFLI